MDTIVNVKSIDELNVSSQELEQVQSETVYASEDIMKMISIMVTDAEKELAISNVMLNEARAREALALVELVTAEAELAAASAELAAASASGNPFAIDEATARLTDAQIRFSNAQSKYNEAVQHRERMEQRVELCERALNQANILYDNTDSICHNRISQIDDIIQRGICALRDAYETLDRYRMMTTTVQRKEYATWKKADREDSEKEKPIMPTDIISRLNPSKSVMLAILAETAVLDYGFGQMIDQLRKENLQGENAKALLSIRQHVSGRLAEEIVKKAFAPYGVIQNQARKELEESYTIVDILLINANNVIILNRGLRVPKGGSLGIEVKTGNKKYLQGQKRHLVETQIPGHAGCDVSCVLMSRDIHALSPTAEQELRNAIANSGSRVLAMLPMKEILDDVCIEFVFGVQQGDKNDV